MLVDHGSHLLTIFELGGMSQVVEQRVVPGPDVFQVLSEGHVEHGLLAHGGVESDLHQEGGLADAGARHDDAQFAGRQPSTAAALEDADRAVVADLFCVHRILSSAGLLARHGGDELGLHRRRYRHVAREFHGELGLALRGRTQGRGVAEHLGQWHFRF